MSTISKVTPTPFDQRALAAADAPIEPALGFADIVGKARTEAAVRGWTLPVGAVAYDARYGVFSIIFFEPGKGRRRGRWRHPTLFYDGRLLGKRQPWTETAADIFVQAQVPLYSGRILRLPGRILISFMGLVVATLSVTSLVARRAGV